MEEGEADHRRDRVTTKEEHMDHSYVITSPLPLGGVFHNL
jgi:hypothetical protein